MKYQTLTFWKVILLALVMITFSTTIHAGDSARSKLPTITEIAETTDGFGILYDALQAAELDETFDGSRHFTVFAPTDDAFAELLGSLGITADQLLADTALLNTVLRFHVTRGDRYSGSVVAAGALKMLDGNTTSISVSQEGAMIENAVITAVDIKASNGVVHIIDRVILPPALQ
jgi:transforming growth factor-beta-induced protein